MLTVSLAVCARSAERFPVGGAALYVMVIGADSPPYQSPPAPHKVFCTASPYPFFLFILGAEGVV